MAGPPQPSSGAGDGHGPPSPESLLPSHLTLPKGGGAIRGLGEQARVNLATGTGSLTIGLPITAGRSGFTPSLALAYDSTAGNGPFGVGWGLSVGSVSRRTDKGVPRYRGETDAFVLAGAEDLVPVLREEPSGALAPEVRTASEDGAEYRVERFRPRVEGFFARIERWTRRSDGDVHWRSTTGSNVLNVYGRSPQARVADPADGRRVFQWMLEESRDDRGNAMAFEYAAEDARNVPRDAASEAHRFDRGFAQRYLKRISYANRAPGVAADWLLELVFDYGDHDPDSPTPTPNQAWPCRPDAFSSYRAGFEVRTYRLCRRVLMFHRFPELGPEPTLVNSLDLGYEEDPVVSRLASTAQTGWKRAAAGYTRKSLPALELEYSSAELDGSVRSLDPDSAADLPAGLDEVSHYWTDLDGEGVAGILSEQAGRWSYKRNLGGGRFSPAEPLAVQPSLADLERSSWLGQSTGARGQRLLDLDGDGTLDLVQLTGVPGFYERAGEGWERFTPLEAVPNVNWDDPSVSLLDLDGDGRADVLVTEDEAFTWYPSAGERGFAEAEVVRTPDDEEAGPALLSHDRTQAILFADMSGDGLADIVRIRNGEVSYYPSLGRCRFGPKVTMDRSPVLDDEEGFDARRVRLFDIDGTGPSDLLYIGGDGSVNVWANQCGNGFGAPWRLDQLPEVDDLSRITLVDLFGNGTGCLVWSSGLPGDAGRALRYVDFLGGTKPHLLVSADNGMGKQTRLSYAPSTRFYLEDRAAGQEWLTKLPFPVHVVDRLEVEDGVTGYRFVSHYSYHHGHFDGVEREFRGFGRVEQRDTESFESFARSGASNAVAADLHQPPVLTKTWFHTGALPDQPGSVDLFRGEYWQPPGGGDPPPEPASLPAGLDVREWRDAVRALKGAPVRQEVFALDGGDDEANPYTVSEHGYEVKRMQPARNGRPAVFVVTGAESVSYGYERNPADPRVSHVFVLETDEMGHPLRSASVAYGRRTVNPALPAEVREEQASLRVSYSETDFTDDVETPLAYRLRMPCEERSYEVTGISPAGPLFRRAELDAAIAATAAIPFEREPDGSAQRRLLSRFRAYYLRDDLSGALPLGELAPLGLPSHSHRLAFTSQLVADLYEGKVSAADLTAAGYVHSEGDGDWWIPSGTAIYPADPAAHFYIPTGLRDPLGSESRVTYDAYDLLVTTTADALGSATAAENDYRTMQPITLTDANLNRTAVEFDELGMVVKTAVMGKAAAEEGDTLADPTVRVEYDLDRWRSEGKPAMSRAWARERHGAENPRWQESFTYVDGGGRTVMVKVQAEPGIAKSVGADGRVTEVDTSPAPRWVGNGRLVVDNKGNPIKHYEPYFSVTPEYEDEAAVVELGVSPVMRYDPLGRLLQTDNPDGTRVRVEFDPWQQLSHDSNDEVLESDWYAERGSPSPAAPAPADPEARAAWLAARHAATPTEVHLDSLGRVVYAVADNGPAGRYGTRTEMDSSRSRVRIFDAKGRVASSSRANLIGMTVRADSLEKGRRWLLPDVLRQPVKMWDAAGRRLRVDYDALHRPRTLWLREGAGAEMALTHNRYGEEHPEAAALNLRGRLHRAFDQAGAMTLGPYDFEGRMLTAERRLARDYAGTIDWSDAAAAASLADLAAVADPALEAERWQTAATMDALGRPISATLADGSVLEPSFDEGNSLQELSVRVRGGASVAFVTGQVHDERRRPLELALGNGTRCSWTYDERSSRPLRHLTTRAADSAVLQDLSYTYDAVGNVVEVRDAAQQTLFFANAVVPPRWRYEYDAVYQLTRAEGREQAAGNGGTRTEADLAAAPLPHPNDAAAVRSYSEEFAYDEAGNITRLRHSAGSGSWTRLYAYQAGSDRLASTSLPGDPASAPFSARYSHDAQGNMTAMPHLPALSWNVLDQLTRVDLGGGGSAHYVYSAGGQRIRKVVERLGGAREERIYLGGVEIYRKWRGGEKVLERQTLHVSDGSRRIAQVDTKTLDTSDPASVPATTTRYQYGNNLGSATLELDENGALLTYEEYHPFGTSAYRSGRAAAETGLKRYRYIGRERDDETGLYACGARYYAPWLGRWTSADPAGFADGLNLFRYCHNDPIGSADPGGCQSDRRAGAPKSGTGPTNVRWIIPPTVTTPARFETWARERGIQYTGTPTYDPATHVWSVDTWKQVKVGQGGQLTPTPAAATVTPVVGTGGTGSGTGGTGGGAGSTGGGTTIGNVLPYSGQGRAERGPPPPGGGQGALQSIDEHGMPGAHLKVLTRNPATGQSDYTDQQYQNATTVRWETGTADAKTNRVPNADNPTWRQLEQRYNSGQPINYREDIFERSRQAAIDAARSTNSAVTEETINTAILAQEGELFSSVPLNQVMSRLPPPSLGERIVTGVQNALFNTNAGRAALGIGGALARSFIPGFVETEVAVAYAGSWAIASGYGSMPVVGTVASAAVAAPAAVTTTAFVSAAAGYFVGDAVESAVTEATGSRGVGVGAGVASAAATGALIGAGIGTIVPVVGTAAGAIVGGVAGAIGGLIGSLW